MKPIQIGDEYHKKLKHLAAEVEFKLKKLMEEALDLLFEKYKDKLK